jgi:hypothetical protein
MSAGDKRDLQTLAIDTLDDWLLLLICFASYVCDMPFPRAAVGAEKNKNHYSRCHSHHYARVIIKTTTVPRTDRNEHEDEQGHEPQCSSENVAVRSNESEVPMDGTDLQHVRKQRYDMNALD